MSDSSNSKDLLTPDELDTLLSGVDEGEVDTEHQIIDGSPVPYDFARQDKIVRGRMPTLEMVNERFARFFRSSVAEMMQQSVDVIPGGINVQKYADYATSLYVPASLSWVNFSPLKGTGLITLDAKLVFKLVDLFFGGSGRNSKIESRDFTATEQRVVTRVVETGFKDLMQAWQSVIDFKLTLLGQESNPNLTNILSPNEMVVSSVFQVDLDGGGGELHIVLPLAMLEPVKDTLDAGLQSDVEKTDDHWSQILSNELMRAEVPVNCQVLECEIALRDILDLQEGDVIPVDMPEQVQLMANRMPIYSGTLGVSGDKIAVQVVQKRTNS